MKKFGFILLILVALLIGYFIWSYQEFSASDVVAAPAGRAIDKNIQEDILSSGVKNIETAKSFVSQIPQAANDAINSVISDVVDQAKDAVREKLDTILGTTSPAYQQTPSPISGNLAIGSASPNSSAEPNVCPLISAGTAVSYEIDQPFPGAQEAAYKIVWGDGEVANGAFKNGEQNITVSHSYSQQGTYPITFQVISGSTTLTASRSVCVR